MVINWFSKLFNIVLGDKGGERQVVLEEAGGR